MWQRNGFWRDRRVFVTGCTGLVGAWTVRALLKQGAHVVGLVRDHVAGSELVRKRLLQRIDIVHGDLENQPLLERALGEYEIQTIFHLAAQTIVGIANRSPLSTFESNIRGTWNLLEAARRTGKPQVIVASSDKAYGTHAELPYREDAPLLAHHPYDVSKACADMIALTYHKTFGLPVCVTRCGNFYGGGDLNWNRIIPGTIRSIERGERPVLRSDGTCLRDYFYVRDGAAAYLHLAECMARQPEVIGEAFNFSTGQPLSVREIVDKLREMMDSRLEPDIRAEAVNEIPHQYLCSDKARKLLGWSPKFSLDDALIETIEWYRRYFARPPRIRKTADAKEFQVSEFQVPS
jgi:CDP-glucose 4,6-dehydratase